MSWEQIQCPAIAEIALQIEACVLTAKAIRMVGTSSPPAHFWFYAAQAEICARRYQIGLTGHPGGIRGDRRPLDCEWERQ